MQKKKTTEGTAKSADACLLIVDDHAQFGAALVTLSQRGGFIAASVRSGQDALDYMLEQPVNIVFTDIFMPDGEGLELLHDLFRRRFHPQVVAMTEGEATGMPDMRPAAALTGAERTIRKPFEPGLLFKLVREMIGESETSSRMDQSCVFFV